MTAQYPIEDSDHAFDAGLILGTFMRAGVRVEPVMEGGDYTAMFKVHIDLGEPRRSIYVIVLPP